MNYPCGKIYTGINQGDSEWHGVKIGKISGSRIADMLSQGKAGAESTGRANYRMQLALERWTNKPCGKAFSNAYMDRGSEDEAAGRLCYEFERGVNVEQVAFIDHPNIPMFGVSPDGLIGEDGMCEIKRKIPTLHYEIKRKGIIPNEYRKQMIAQLSCSGRLWNDFISYCPEFSPEHQLIIIRLERDDAEIQELEKSVISFNEDVENTIADCKAIFK